MILIMNLVQVNVGKGWVAATVCLGFFLWAHAFLKEKTAVPWEKTTVPWEKTAVPCDENARCLKTMT